MLDLKNRIVEFLNDGELLFGIVTESAASKLQLTDANGRNRKIASRYVLIVHSIQTTLAEFNSSMQPLKEQIESLASEVDTELLWEVTASWPDALDKACLAREYFGEEDSRSQSAVLRAAMADPVHFRLKGVEIYSRTREQVEQQLHQRQVEQQREARWNGISQWLTAALLESEMQSVEGEFETLLDTMQEFLLSRRRDPPAFLTEAEPEIWKRTPSLRELTPREVAFQVLICAGRLPEDADPLLVIAGVEAAFSPEAEEAVKRLEPFVFDEARRDLRHLRAFAVDDSETLEVDDAITLESNENGWTLGIHIADVTPFVEPSGTLFEEAFNRASSLYLPHRLLTMLPPRLSCDLASLQPGRLRPVISTLVEVNRAGEITHFQICRGQLELDQRLTYEQVDQLLQTEDPVWKWLSWFTDLRREERKKDGAVSFNTPEFKVRVDQQDQISVSRLDSDSPSRGLVAELMILANSLAARFARERDLQLIYRSQKPPRKKLEVPEDYDPVALIEVFRALERSLYGLEPEPHSGLGLEAYAQTTSPLRRLADLISQLQLSAHLQEQPPAFDEQELRSRIGNLSETERNLRAVERRAISYYVLKHLWEAHRTELFPAIVLGPADRGFQVEFQDYPVRARLLSGKVRPEAGQRIEVKMEQVDLDRGTLVVRGHKPGQ